MLSPSSSDSEVKDKIGHFGLDCVPPLLSSINTPREPYGELQIIECWTVVVAQLVEWSLPTPEIRNSNPDISKILSSNCTIEKTKIMKKRPGMAHL